MTAVASPIQLDISLNPCICSLEDVVAAYRTKLLDDPQARPTSDSVYFSDSFGNNMTLDLNILRETEPKLFEQLKPFLR